MNVRVTETSNFMRAALAGLALGVAAAGQAQDTAGAASQRQAARAAAAADAEPAVTSPAPVTVPASVTAPAAVARRAAGAAQAAGAAVRPKPAAGAAGGRGRERRAMDTLELDPTQIIGNRELPKVMVVVPWKRSDIGDLVGRPVNSLVDEALAPVDRDVFKREIAYYGALAPDRRNETPVTPAAAGAPAAKPEK